MEENFKERFGLLRGKKRLSIEEKEELQQQKIEEERLRNAREMQRDEQEFLAVRKEVLALPPDRRSYHELNEKRFKFFWKCTTRQNEIPDEIMKIYREISEKYFTEFPKRMHVAVIYFMPLFEKFLDYFKPLGTFQQGGMDLLFNSEMVDKKYAKY